MRELTVAIGPLPTPRRDAIRSVHAVRASASSQRYGGAFTLLFGAETWEVVEDEAVGLPAVWEPLRLVEEDRVGVGELV